MFSLPVIPISKWGHKLLKKVIKKGIAKTKQNIKIQTKNLASWYFLFIFFFTSGSFSFCCAKCEEGGVHQFPCPPMLSAYLLPKFIWLSVLLDLYIKQETFKYTWIRVYFTWSNLIHFFVWKKGKIKKLLSSRPILNHLIA